MFMYEIKEGPLKGGLAIDLDMKNQIPANLATYKDETDGQIKEYEDVDDVLTNAQNYTKVPEVIYFMENKDTEDETDDVVHLYVKKSGKLEEVTL